MQVCMSALVFPVNLTFKDRSSEYGKFVLFLRGLVLVGRACMPKPHPPQRVDRSLVRDMKLYILVVR